MEQWMNRLRNKTRITTRIMIVVIAVGLGGAVISSYLIERTLETQIAATTKRDVRNFGESIFLSIQSKYKTFFFEFGNDKELYDKAAEASRQETLGYLRQIYEKENDRIYIVAAAETFPISSGAKREKEAFPAVATYKVPQVEMTENDFVYSRRFLPWGWTLVVVRDKSAYAGIVEQNNRLIVGSIGGMILFMVLMLAFILTVTIQRPLSMLFEHIGRIRKGEYVALEVDSSSEITLLVDLINQMTERVKNREQMLQEEMYKNRSVLDLQHDIVLVTNGKELLDVNRAFFNYIDGYDDLASFKNEHTCICEFFLDRPGYLKQKMGELTWVEYMLDHPNLTHRAIMMKKGRELTFSVNVNKIQLGAQELFVVSMGDITELESYKQRLEEKVALEVAKNREKDHVLHRQSKTSQMGEMLSMIAHQWRQPINAISASAMGLSMKQELGALTPEGIEEHATFVQQQTQKMSKTINDFMNFFKPEHEKTHFVFSAVIEDIRSLMGVQLQSRGIDIRCECGLEQTIFGYEKELAHVLINLIANARDAYEANPVEEQAIILALSQEADALKISVSDHAGGIPENILETIFDPYFTTKEQGKGTGIGLYMSRRIVEEVLHGTIEATNCEKGACFTITLPVEA